MSNPGSNRATPSAIQLETANKIQQKFDGEDAAKCVNWVNLITNNNSTLEQSSTVTREQFWELFKDGILLSKLRDALVPGSVNWESKTYQSAKIPAMDFNRTRERIAAFNKFCIEYGVKDTYTFPPESLMEFGLTMNLTQVCVCIRQLGTEAQQRADYSGPADYWPRKNAPNVRTFTDEQRAAGQAVIGLQMGSNKGASQAGQSFGKTRHIVD